MLPRDQIKRTTFSANRRYFILAEAIWFKPHNRSARIIVKAEVFEGHPSIYGNEPIYLVDGKANTFDLLDALQSIEAAARRYVDSLPR